MGKVFGIGLPRTGSRSLWCAFAVLGNTSRHYPESEDLDKYDYFTEVRFDIKCLQDRYHDARYILTIRDLDSWLASCNKHKEKYIDRWNPFWLEPSNWESIYYERLESIKSLDSSKVLTINICSGEGWDKLCPFLGCPIPNLEFPWWNKTLTPRELIPIL